MSDHRLPVKQLVVLSICRFAEPIALTSVFPYVPELMESFGIPQNDIARWAGIASSSFSICQAFTGILWGAASDRYGRKPIILFGLFNTMWTMLLWGFSVNLPMAITARALGGLSNGNVGILRTTVAELCPWKELQPRAFSVMPLVWTVGATFGPTLGGALANPLGVDPRKPRGDAFFARFPYLLPNLVASAFFTIGILVGWLFLQETLESKKHAPDLGLRTGVKLTAFIQRLLHLPTKKQDIRPEREPLLSQQKLPASETTVDATVKAKEKPSTIRDAMTFQTSMNLMLLPVFMHHPVQQAHDSTQSLPLKFAGGFGIESRRIGIIFTIFAIFSTLSQFLLFPPIARTLGVLRCLRIAFFIFPFCFFLTPFLSLIPDALTREIAMVMLLMVRGLAGTFAFPTTTIMLTNSAPSLRVLGTINGLATSFSALGRAVGPTLTGGLFTWGVKRGYVIVPFWFLSAVAFIALIPTLWLVEGKGFGDESDIDDEENVILTDDEEAADDISRTRSPLPIYDEAALSESEFGDVGETPNILSYTNTRSSPGGGEEDEVLDFVTRSESGNTVRRNTVRKRSSVPIGMGKGFRRYSSNLGSTGIGGGGASWGGA
ncbi:MFS transporter [Pyrenophora seminiperda CCB06]|uniref:MFS transporter n=1 Tax=Pyrenophora seminiperda CCB06 TaxID=1302712 RepID=A0A3M7M255_9PLEO|nr:MFS transporter [Pyrenophora seminiperda CCB06]